jgi:hypothetical protein
MDEYFTNGERLAKELGNRGPLEFDSDGGLAAHIRNAYSTNGFYVFEGALQPGEILEVRREFLEILDRAPVEAGSDVDPNGRAAIDQHLDGSLFRFAKPLSDPYGATEHTEGRYPVKMHEPLAPQGAPEQVVLMVAGILQLMDSTLSLYGHPQLLAVAAAINGPDFTPFTEVIWVKQPGLGAAVSWHQDGTTHWQNPDLDEGTHGFNFMVNLYATNTQNSLWIVPGSHRHGRADLKQLLVDNDGSDRLAGAVPLLCQPGDVAICSRQVVHGSFANVSDEMRATFVFGFHRRESVAGVKGWGGTVYDDAYIQQRSEVIALGQAVRRKKFPDEPKYAYTPMRNVSIDTGQATRERVLKNYHLRNIGI